MWVRFHLFPMARNASRIAHLSRDKTFLTRAFFAIVIGCGVLGLGLSELRSKAGHRERFDILSQIPVPDQAVLEDFLVRGEASPEAYAAFIRHCRKLAAFAPDDVDPAARDIIALFASSSIPTITQAAAAASALGPEGIEVTGEILANYATALYPKDEAARAALQALESWAGEAQPARFACECAADILQRRAHGDEAKTLFAKEVAHHPESDFARASLVTLFLADAQGGPALKELLRDKANGRALDSHTRMRAALAAGDLGELLIALHYNRYSEVTLSLLSVTLFAGLIWFIILAKLGGVKRLHEARMAFCGAAVLLGMLSAKATLLAVVLQEHLFGLKENGEFLNDLVFFISGVGLREETLKLLFLVPLAPFVLRRKSEAEMLAVSACVGLGFAIEENIGYFLGGSGFFGRMLMANFLHIALTGTLGLAFFRLCRWPRTRWEEFLGTFLAAVILHGLYDAFISLPDLRHLDMLALFLFVLIAYRFLQLAKEAREPGFNVISPLGVFVIGCALLAGGVWLYSAWIFPLREAIKSVGNDAFGIATLGFLYINQFRDE